MCRYIGLSLLLAFTANAAIALQSGPLVRPTYTATKEDTLLFLERLDELRQAPSPALPYLLHKYVPGKGATTAMEIVPAQSPLLEESRYAPAGFTCTKDSRCFLAEEAYALLQTPYNDMCVIIDLRSGTSTIHHGYDPLDVLQSGDGRPLLFGDLGGERDITGIRIYQPDADGWLLLDDRIVPQTYFFTVPQQASPYILARVLAPSERNDRRAQHQLELLRLARGGGALERIATLPSCVRVLGVAIDQVGNIIAGIALGRSSEARLLRISPAPEYAVTSIASIPGNGRFYTWSMSNISSAGEIVVASRTHAARDKGLEAQLLRIDGLGVVWSGILDVEPSWGAGVSFLDTHEFLVHSGNPHTQLNDGSIVYDSRWDLYRIEVGPDGQRSIHPLSEHNFQGTPKDKLAGRTPTALAALEGFGFLYWQEGALQLLR